MFPPVASRDSILSDEMHPCTRAYHDVVIYGDAASDDVLYEGPIVVHANGWIELEGDRLLSPQAVNHIDIHDDERGEWATGDDSDNSDGGDDYRTNRFGTQ